MPEDGDNNSDILDAEFLVDGNSVLAVLIPPVWLIWHRLWWALGVYLTLGFAISLMLLTPYANAALFLAAIPGLYLMLEGNELIRQKYEHAGWRFAGVVQAGNIEEAQIRFIENHQPAPKHAAPISTPSTTIRKSATSSIGLFPLEG